VCDAPHHAVPVSPRAAQSENCGATRKIFLEENGGAAACILQLSPLGHDEPYGSPRDGVRVASDSRQLYQTHPHCVMQGSGRRSTSPEILWMKSAYIHVCVCVCGSLITSLESLWTKSDSFSGGFDASASLDFQTETASAGPLVPVGQIPTPRMISTSPHGLYVGGASMGFSVKLTSSRHVPQSDLPERRQTGRETGSGESERRARARDGTRTASSQY
jgi:hypothetical protein